MGTSPGSRSAVALAVPEGASSFVSAWSSTISASGRCRPASAAKRSISTAPSAKFGATKHGTPRARASSSKAARSAGPSPVVPDDRGDAGLQAALDVAAHRARER